MFSAAVGKLCQHFRSLRAGCGGGCDEAPKHEPCCAIPESGCPPRVVGAISFKIGRGAVPEATIVVRNVGKSERAFSFVATELAGPSAGSAKLVVHPETKRLAPGEQVVVKVTLSDSKTLTPLQTYRAEILIRGAFEQCVTLTCEVGRDVYDECAVAQGSSLKDRALHLSQKPTLTFKLQRGMIPEAVIRVDNHGRSTQVFTITPSALVGAPQAGATLAVTPDALQLSTGQSGVVRMQLRGSLGLTAGQAYRGEVTIQGFLEDRVAVCAEVIADASDHVEVAQGEPPTFVRAHHWYHHFQCTEPCRNAP